MDTNNQKYSFDPLSIVKIISENPQIGLAIVQIPIDFANTLMRNYSDLKWKDNPTKPGYYWVKSADEVITIKEYSSKDIDNIISTELNGVVKNLFKFFGPLEPPQ